ncbi:MAG: SGNH/GDSL hydrolase family protein [Aeromicrobium sp.]|uniref:SGNH/GDSL hydrolase family protein n=1 Tax=Aeromicrobium sp. TaxID=1871063 RepID=UPI0039E25691
MTWQRYVALGDSFTEGVGDPDAGRPNGVRGWADRFAGAMGARLPELQYANLAIRGRKMRAILAEQVEPALALRPDLVSIYAGANDVLRPSIDIDALMDDYDAAIARLSASAHVVMFTAYDPGGDAIFAMLRGRFAIYNEMVREIAERHGATLVDFWRMREYRDGRYWDVDRIHMSSVGHQRMAVAVADALGVRHDLAPLPLPDPPSSALLLRAAANAAWAGRHAAPWIGRRLRGTSSGDALNPRHAVMVPARDL